MKSRSFIMIALALGALAFSVEASPHRESKAKHEVYPSAVSSNVLVIDAIQLHPAMSFDQHLAPMVHAEVLEMDDVSFTGYRVSPCKNYKSRKVSHRIEKKGAVYVSGQLA